MNKITLAEDINWVGVVDWNIRDFHGYTTRRGSTYNAYLIKDEKTALIDTVKQPFASELLQRISEIIDPEKIDYIIINHVEMDHSSSLPIIAKQAKNATIIASQKGKDAIIEHYGSDFNIQTVKTGDELKLGKRTLRVRRSPHAPLARQHVHLRRGRQDSHAQRRLRTTSCHPAKIRRRG